MAPVIKELGRRRNRFRVTNVLTGQHREMSRPYLSLFYHRQLPVGHVEAGLRTNNKYNTFPEELNRRLIGTLADLHFAPTQVARRNLLREGVSGKNIFVTGNTVIDALKSVAQQRYSFTDPVLAKIAYARRRVICVTTHRRESFGLPIRNILNALRRIADRYPDVEIVIPVHYNPNVRQQVFRSLHGVERIHLVNPLPYEAFVHLMNRSHVVLTDSGGIQEEAPALGKPVLVLRETTERPEGIRAGTAKLVGTNFNSIVNSTAKLLDHARAYRAMAQAVNPYGDGRASVRIVRVLQARYG